MPSTGLAVHGHLSCLRACDERALLGMCCVLPQGASGGSPITGTGTTGLGTGAVERSTPLIRPITVPTLNVLVDVDVRVRMSHNFAGDLFLALRSPTGRVVVLQYKSGESQLGFLTFLGHHRARAYVRPPVNE